MTLYDQISENGVVVYNRDYPGSYEITENALSDSPPAKDLLESYINLLKNIDAYNRRVNLGFVFFFVLSFIQSFLLVILTFSFEINQEKKESDFQKQIAYRDDVIHHYAHLSSLAGISGDIIHQWKQPLNNLMMIISNIQNSVAEKDYDILNELSLDAKKVITLFSSTISDFREMLISESTDSLFDMKDVVDNAMLLFKRTLIENEIRCEMKYDGNVRIRGKKSRLMQVFNNLFDNSIYAIKDREIQNGLITICCRENDSEVIVLFEDNGGGITMDVQENMFHAYYTSKGSKGSGLGLSISREVLAKYFGGTMTFRNTECGVEFEMVIPKFGGRQ
jgi:signal transduction histidine kinase